MRPSHEAQRSVVVGPSWAQGATEDEYCSPEQKNGCNTSDLIVDEDAMAIGSAVVVAMGVVVH